MYSYIKSSVFNLDKAMTFINNGQYEIVSVTQNNDGYTIFYKDNKNMW